MNRLLLCVVFAGIFVVANAGISDIVGTVTDVMEGCRDKKEGCKISDEMFRRFMKCDKTLLDEGVSSDENKAAWSWVSCWYENMGMVDEGGNISEDGLDMPLEMLWKDKEEKEKNAEALKSCAKEGNEKGSSRDEKMFLFYKCSMNKDISVPASITAMKEKKEATKECIDKYPITMDDFINMILLRPMTDTQGAYSACVAIVMHSEGDKIPASYIVKGFEKIKDEERRKKYEEAYAKCKDEMDGYQESYHKDEEFDKMKGYVIYMHDCLAKNVDKMSWDDFYSMEE